MRCPHQRTWGLHGAALLLALWPACAGAVEIEDGKLSIDGFGRWAMGDTLGSQNDYVFAKPKGNYDSGQFALCLTARPIQVIAVGAQVDFDPDMGGLSLDWAFVDYRPSDAFHIHAGRFKHAFGIFGETLKVGTLDPFLFLPITVYGDAEFAVNGVEGLGISGSVESGRWRLTYDAYGGDFDSPISPLYANAIAAYVAQTGQAAPSSDEARGTIGGRLILETPVLGLSVRLSAYTNLEDSALRGRRLVLGPSAEYVNDAFTVRAEYFHHEDFGTQNAIDFDDDAAYLEAGYFLTEHLELALRGEYSQTHSGGTVLAKVPHSASLDRHRELAATIDWWFTPSVVAKLSGHWVNGNHFALPTDVAAATNAGALQPQTSAAMAGVQFSF